MSVDGGAPTNLFTNFSGGSGNQLFGGVVDSTPFTSVTIRNSASGDFIEFDNVRFGAAVPEPTSLSLFALVGAVGLAYARKRRKAAQGA
jgi:hypothetical protein